MEVRRAGCRRGVYSVNILQIFVDLNDEHYPNRHIESKAGKLLKDLADLKLISIRDVKANDGFTETLKRIRAKNKGKSIPLSNITKEVEQVRAKRYGI